MAAFAVRACAGVLYLAGEGGQVGGALPGTVYGSIAEVLEAANDGDEIRIMPGEYPAASEQIVQKAVAIKGMGSSPGDTVIYRSGNSYYRVFSLKNANAVLQNLTVKGGFSNETRGGGGGVKICEEGGQVLDCHIIDCQVSMAYGCSGGGLYLASDNAIARRCLVANNRVNDLNGWGGSGISIAKGLVESTLVVFNMDDSQLPDNSATKGAVYMTGGLLLNSTIACNEQLNIGGVYASGGRVVNCVIGKNATIRNTTPEAVVFGGNASLFENCLSDGVLINESCFTGEISFANPHETDFSLPASSLAIDRAKNEPLSGDADFCGNARSALSGQDIGAVELQRGFTLDFRQTGKYEEGKIAFAVSEAVPGSIRSVSWDYGDGSAPGSGTSAAKAYSSPGIYTVRATAVTQEGTEVLTREVCVRGKNIYLSPSQNAFEAPPYATEETALSSLHKAISFAEEGQIVVLMDGTHKPGSIARISKGIGIEGQTRDGAILSGGFLHQVISLSHHDAFLSGLTVRDGMNKKNNNGGGVYIGERGGTVTNSLITANRCYVWGAMGAGVFMRNGLLTHSVITKNDCDDNGAKGGAGVALSGGRVENCLISENYTALANMIPGRAEQKAAGGIYMTGGTVANTTVANNRSLNVGGICLEGGTVINTIIAGNTSEGGLGVPTAKVYDGPSSAFSACLSDGEEPINGNCIAGEPGFDENYRLTALSMAIDAGTIEEGAEYCHDLGGGRRITGKAIDIGCYEFGSGDLSVAISPVEESGVVPYEVVFNASVVSPEGEAVTLKWNFGDGTEILSTDEKTVTHTFGEIGDFAVSVRAETANAFKEAALPGAIRVRPQRIYLKADSSAPQAPYDTPEKAFSSMSEACQYAANGTEIIVCPGRYPNSSPILLDRAVRIAGQTKRPEDAVIYRPGSGNGRHFTLRNPGAVIDSVAIEGGKCNINDGFGGGNVAIAQEGGSVKNCIIRNGYGIYTSLSYGVGGGIYVASGNGLVENCVITNNYSNDHNNRGGSGAYLNGGRIVNCLIAGNRQDVPLSDNSNNRGALLLDRGAVAVNCTVAGNTHNNICGLYIANGTAVNCIIAENRPKYQGANTLANAYTGGANHSSYVNCAIDTEEYSINESTISGNLDFIDSANGNYRLGENSVALDSGSMECDFGKWDLDGNARVSHRTVDIGCYERVYIPKRSLLMMR